MQETRNNCFGSKKRSTILLQAETGKHECRNVTATVLLTKVLFNHAFYIKIVEGINVKSYNIFSGMKQYIFVGVKIRQNFSANPIV